MSNQGKLMEQGMVAKINKINKIVFFLYRFELECGLDVNFSIKDLTVILNEYLQVERQMSFNWKEKKSVAYLEH